LWDVERSAVIQRRNVVFDENSFSFLDKAPKSVAHCVPILLEVKEDFSGTVGDQIADLDDNVASRKP
jgi:hypothetical protein